MKHEATIGQRVSGIRLPIRSEKEAEDLREAHGLPRKLAAKPPKEHPAADVSTGTEAGMEE